MPLTDQDKKIAFGIVKHLQAQLESGRLEEDAAESVSVAMQCLCEAYQADPQNPLHKERFEVKPTLEELFSTAPPASKTNLDKAEAFKQQGNAHLKLNKFPEAVSCYSRAINIDPSNATYFCNRAAAYIKLQDMDKALEDCKQAVSLNPSYARAHGRMGYVLSSLDRLKESRDCFKKAIELDPENDNYKSNLSTVEQQIKTKESEGASAGSVPTSGATPQGASQQQPGAGPGATGFGPGMPNIAGLFSNPTFMNMATSLMSTPAFQEMASNMMSRGGPGAGMAGMMPDVYQMASDMQQNNPELFENLRQQASGLSQGSRPPHGGGAEGKGGADQRED